ncbi:hypothetical protein E1100_07775 [Vibrio owensii]|uniref:hypothetical protein n=1 Tax=Vibrio owensii TaxID=696485 RepID=UPI00104F6047|nr:hypothetical protein [Vibrio owensii]NOI73127.1 hypothetical protein [Vibrio owensii]TDE24661.1 hypothetical protein E1100_07775 [Vibrio owensii]
MRYDQLANELFSLFFQYSNENKIKPNGANLHELLYFHDCYFYLDRDIQPERLLAASIFAINRYNAETHYFDQGSRLNFYQNVQRLAIKHITDKDLSLTINPSKELPFKPSGNEVKLLQEILHRLRNHDIIHTKKSFCIEVGLDYIEISKNRKNTSKDLLIFMDYCQKHDDCWWFDFVSLVEDVLCNNMARYFHSHHRNFISRSKGIFTRVHCS